MPQRQRRYFVRWRSIFRGIALGLTHAYRRSAQPPSACPGARSPVGIAACADTALARVRTCYRHLAGQLGVALFDNLRKRHGLELTADAVRLSPRGLGVLERAGLLSREDEAARLPGRGCLDWTERRYHLAGALGIGRM